MAVTITQKSTGKMWTSDRKSDAAAQEGETAPGVRKWKSGGVTISMAGHTGEVQRGLSLPALEEAVPAAKKETPDYQRAVELNRLNHDLNRLEAQRRQAAADLDTDALNRINGEMKRLRAAQDPNRGFWKRLGNTVKGGAKGFLSSHMDTMGTLYQNGQGGRDARGAEELAAYRSEVDRAERELKELLEQDGLSVRKILDGMPQEDGLFSTKRRDYLAAAGVRNPSDVLAVVNILEDYQRKAGAMEQASGVQRQAGEAARELAAAVGQSAEQDLERAKEGKSGAQNILVDAAASTVQMAGDAAANMILGTPGSMIPFAARAFGGGTMKARAEGANLKQQNLYGAAIAAKEVITEKLFSVALPFSKAYGGGALDDAVERAIGKAVERFARTDAGKKLLGGGLTFAASALSEGAEEFIGDWMEWQLPRIYGGKPASAEETLEDSLYDFLVGVTSGGIGGLVNPGTYSYEVRPFTLPAPGDTGTQTAGTAPADVQNVLPEGDTRTAVPEQTPEGGKPGTEGAAPPAGEAAVNENGLTALTEPERINLSGGKKNRIVSTFQEAVSFIQNALSDRQNVDRAYLGKIPEATARMVLDETGMEVRGYQSILSGDNVRNIMKKHGDAHAEASRGRIAVTENDIALIPQILSAPDKVSLSAQTDSRGQSALVFEKQIGDRLITMQGASDGKKSLQTDTLYIQKGRARMSQDTMPGAESTVPVINARSELPQSSSVIRISRPAGEVNGGRTWNGGMNDGEGAGGTVAAEAGGDGEGAVLFNEDQKWHGGVGAGEPVGGVGGGAGRARRTADPGAAAIERQALGKTFRGEKVSSRSLGISSGTDAAEVTVIPESVWDEGLRNAAEKVERKTGKRTVFVLGRIPVVGADGKVRKVRGVRMDGGIVLQADNYRASVEQIADHEIFHDLAAAEPGLVRALEDRISETMGREELNRVIDAYMDALDGVYDYETATGEELERAYLSILEEIYADAYAGINAFGVNAGQFSTAVEQTLEDRGLGRRGQETGAATDRTTGPPETERFSIGYDEDNRPFVTVEEDILDGVPREKWIDTVKGTLKQKFPMGVRLGNNTIKINSQTRREMTFSEYTKWLARNDRETYANKFRAANNADEIILASRDYINEGLRHERRDNIRDFARGTVQLRVGESDYTAEVIVGTTSGGDMLLYDIVNLQPATIKERSRRTVQPNQTESRRSGAPASMDSITQTGQESKGENQELKELGLPKLEEEKGPRFSVDDTGAEWENRPKTELEAVEQELERRRNLDYQTELLRQGGAAAIRENETKIRHLEKRADRLRGAEQRKKERPAKKERTEKRRAPRKPVAESKPIIAKRDLRKNLLGIFSIPESRRAELGTMVDSVADQLLREGALTDEIRNNLFDRLYSSGIMTAAADEYYKEGRNAVAGGRIYVNDMIRGDFGEDWNDFRKRAFAAGVYLTNDRSDAGVDVWNQDMSEILPGMFDADELDGRTALERIVQIAEEGRDEKVSLAEYTKRLVGEEYVSEREVLDNLERQMDWALRTFAEKASLEIRLRDRTGVKIAREREQFAESFRRQREREALRRGKEREQRQDMIRRQREDRQLRELQQRTLKQLQWLNKNRYRAPEKLRSAWDQVLGDIDIYAAGAANEMNWSKKYEATWRDLAQMYQEAKESDPNFLPSKDLERIVKRLNGDKITDMDIGALQDLYKAAVGLRTEFYNRNNVIGDEQGRIFAEVYADSKREIEEAPESYTGKGLDKFVNLEQLTPMNVLERMGGWNPEGAFYSMAKQLEQGERAARVYAVEAKRQIEDFLTEYHDWVKRADGQGKDAVWYELEVPELLKLGMGDKPIFGETVKVYMTPAQKVHLYLESRSTDNLRHMTGGRTFVNRELYSQGKQAEAMAQGITVKLAPETVKKITSDLTEEELALAKALEGYYNGFASERINRVSNALYGYDKAVSKNYAPIFTNQNYTKSEIGIYDATAEGVGHLKGRQYAVNPSCNISAFDAFERHIDQTSRFVGMAIPARNWQTLLNWREANNSTGDVITHKWGQEGKRYIENLLTELQGGKIEEKSGAEKLADTVLSNYISSVFGANPSIVFKQAMSFPLAGTYLGWENVPNIQKALAVDDKLINTYTSELAYRLMGYATPETAQLKNNPSMLSENKFLKFTFGGGAITAMDGWTVKSMWRWAENAVRRENPELEIGTQEQIEAGQSPFYQEVARRFEEAVSRSQPMYDVMHRSGAMRSSSGIARALTLFKTVPQQQYNMLRQTVAEAQRAKRVHGEKSGEYREAKKRAGRAVQGVILAGLGIEAINFLNAMLKNGAKRYKDEDEDEITWASAGKQFLQGFMADNMGMMIGGDLIAEVLGSAVTGDKWYGIETPGITQIQDVLEEFLTGCKNIQKLVQDGYGIVKNGGDLKEYFRRHGADYLGALEEGLRTVAKYFGGIPADNIRGYALGALRWISPETETAYQDWMKTADKSGLKGLKGEALETRVADILKNRLGAAEESTAAELADLYAAGYKAAVPTDTPGSISVDGDTRKLNVFQQQLYDSVWRETVGGSLDDVVGSGTFREADQETRANMLKSLYGYAGELAKAEVFDDYELSAGTKKAKEVLESGLNMEDYLALQTAGGVDRYLKAAGQGMRPEDAAKAALAVSEIRGASEEKTPNLILYREVLRTTRDEGEQMAALSLLMSEGEYAKLETGVSRGVTPEMYVTARESIAEIDENGSVNQDEAARAIGSMPGLTDEERGVLWQMQNKSWKPDKNPFSVRAGREIYEAFQEQKEETEEKELRGLELPGVD